MLSAIISFNPKFNRHLIRVSEKQYFSDVRKQDKINRLSVRSVKDKDFLLSVSLIHASTGR